MRQPGGGAHLPAKTLDRRRLVDELAVEHLQSDWPLHEQMLGLVDRSHPSDTKQSADPVARVIQQRCRQSGRRSGGMALRLVEVGPRVAAVRLRGRGAQQREQRIGGRPLYHLATQSTTREVGVDAGQFLFAELAQAIRSQDGAGWVFELYGVHGYTPP